MFLIVLLRLGIVFSTGGPTLIPPMDVEIDAEVEKGHRHKRGEELKGRRTQQEVPGEIKLSIALVGRDNAVADDRFPEDDGRAVKEEGQHPHRHHLENSLVGHVPLSSVFNLCQKRGTSMTHSDVPWTETLHHNNTARYISNTHSCSEYLPQMNPLLHCAALEQERDAVNKTHSWSFYTTVCLRSQREKGNVRLTATFTDATLVWKRHLVFPSLTVAYSLCFHSIFTSPPLGLNAIILQGFSICCSPLWCCCCFLNLFFFSHNQNVSLQIQQLDICQVKQVKLPACLWFKSNWGKNQ